MTEKEFKKLREWLDEALDGARKEALSDGASVNEVNRTLPVYKMNLLRERGINIEQFEKYEEAEKKGESLADIPVEEKEEDPEAFQKGEKQGMINTLKDLFKRINTSEETASDRVWLEKEIKAEMNKLFLKTENLEKKLTLTSRRGIILEIEMLENEHRGYLDAINEELKLAPAFLKEFGEYHQLKNEDGVWTIKERIDFLKEIKKNNEDLLKKLARIRRILEKENEKAEKRLFDKKKR